MAQFSQSTFMQGPGRSYSVSVFIDEGSDEIELTWHIRAEGEVAVNKRVSWKVTAADTGYVLKFETDPESLNAAACLARCVSEIIGDAGAATKCLKDAKDLKEARECVSKHMGWPTAQITICMAECFAGG